MPFPFDFPFEFDLLEMVVAESALAERPEPLVSALCQRVTLISTIDISAEGPGEI